MGIGESMKNKNQRLGWRSKARMKTWYEAGEGVRMRIGRELQDRRHVYRFSNKRGGRKIWRVMGGGMKNLEMKMFKRD